MSKRMEDWTDKEKQEFTISYEGNAFIVKHEDIVVTKAYSPLSLAKMMVAGGVRSALFTKEADEAFKRNNK